MFGFLRARRRKKILAEPFPAAWQAILHRHVALYATLDSGERSALRDAVQVFVAEKNWEHTADFEHSQPMQVVVAANACILTLGLHGDPLRHARTIILQPDTYVPPQPMIRNGIAQSGMNVTGTAYLNGPVILSWREIIANSRLRDGRNVVLHEFAHQLDMAGGVVDGTPPLPHRKDYAEWRRVMTAEYEQLQFAAEHGVRTVVDHYGATNPAEFFAVATELFFEKSRQMMGKHPELYGLLVEYYRQDPASRPRTTG